MYGIQWCNEAVIAIVSYGTASEDADESGWRSIGAMVVEIWPTEDTSKVGGSNNAPCNHTHTTKHTK